MLTIEFRRINAIAILDLSGSIDMDASNFIENVGWCLENGYRDLLCNFENVNMVDYAGLSVISIAYRNVINHQGRIKFVNVPPHVSKIFSLVHLDRVFEICQTEDFALRSFEEDRIICEIKKMPLRRRFKRLPLDIDIQFKSKSESKFHHGKVLNISAVGLLVFTEEKAYPLGEILDIKLALSPLPGMVELETKVVWLVDKNIQPQIYPGMGLEFYEINNAMQAKIVEFVERNLPLNNNRETN
ncbi:STAS domain-containing protein [bacterium]|nr:MAG: STAS domain-containing protein [bacterium]